jgi:hypothetical protein
MPFPWEFRRQYLDLDLASRAVYYVTDDSLNTYGEEYAPTSRYNGKFLNFKRYFGFVVYDCAYSKEL